MSATLHVPTKIELLELLAALGTAQWADFASAAAHHGLTSTQAKVLAQLDGPLPMRGLAALLVCDASNVTGIVDRLEARGLVRREADTADRRVKQTWWRRTRAATPSGACVRRCKRHTEHSTL